MSTVNRIRAAREGGKTTNGHATEAAPRDGGIAPAAAPKGGRDPRGRFTLGNAGGPGNPYARRTAELRRDILAAVTSEDFQAIARKLIAQAKEGDVPSAKLLFSYTLGKPAEAVEPDAIEFHEWELFCRQPVPAAQIETILASFPVDMVCQLMRYVLPCVVQSSKSKFLAMMQARDWGAKEGAPSVEGATPPEIGGAGTGGSGVPPVAHRRDACATGAVPTSAAPSPKGTNGNAAAGTSRTGVSGPPAARRSPSAKGSNGSRAPAKRLSRAARILTSGLRQARGV